MNHLKIFSLLRTSKDVFRNFNAKLKNTSFTQANRICYSSDVKHITTDLHKKEIPLPIDDETLKMLAETIPDSERKIKLIMLEMENLRCEGFDFPEDISKKNWLKILKTTKYFERKKIYSNLSKKKLFEVNQVNKRINYETKLQNINQANHLEYRIGKNCNLLRIYPSQISELLNRRLYTAQLFPTDVVFDMGFESFMNDNQIKICATHLHLTFLENRNFECPFNIHLCNFPKNSKLSECINTAFGVNIHNVPINVHEGSYLDIFEKDRLVYLSSDAASCLEKYDSDAVYIIGGLVDFGSSMPISVRKAKVEKIKTAKFPVDKYLDWKGGHKSFAFNTVLNVMHDMQYYRDWRLAFKNLSRKVPGDDSRKIFEFK